MLSLLMIIVFISAGWWFFSNHTADKDGGTIATSTAETITVELLAQNNSGTTGRATLTEEDGKVRVALALTGSASSTPQPAHIHTGTCPNPDAVKYSLLNVVNGMSDTLLDISFAELKSALPLAVNVHKSPTETRVYVACGNLVFPSMMSETNTGTTTASTTTTTPATKPANKER